MVKSVIASDGKPINVSDIPFGLSEKEGIRYSSPIPLMERYIDRADTTITVMGFELSYDSLGYCWRRSKINHG